MRSIERVNFTDPSYLKRIRKFDRIKDTASQLLKDSLIRNRLSHTVDYLDEINSSVFLPNVRGGELVVPKSVRETDGVAIFPFLNEDKGPVTLKIWPSFSHAVSTVEQSYLKTLKEERGDFDTAVELIKIRNEIIDDTGAFLYQAMSSIALGAQLADGLYTAGATYSEQGIVYQNSNAYYATRPIIFMAPFDEDTSDVMVGSAILHEYWHAYKSIVSRHHSDDISVAREELEAYHITRVCMDLYANQLHDDEQICMYNDRQLDNMRLLYPDKADPFIASPRLLHELSKIGLLECLGVKS